MRATELRTTEATTTVPATTVPTTTVPAASARALRRRVHRVTVGVAGVAALASTMMTAGLVHAADGQHQRSSTSTLDGSDLTGGIATTRPTQPPSRRAPAATSAARPSTPTGSGAARPTPAPAAAPPAATVQRPAAPTLVAPTQRPAAGSGPGHLSSGGS